MKSKIEDIEARKGRNVTEVQTAFAMREDRDQIENCTGKKNHNL